MSLQNFIAKAKQLKFTPSQLVTPSPSMSAAVGLSFLAALALQGCGATFQTEPFDPTTRQAYVLAQDNSINIHGTKYTAEKLSHLMGQKIHLTVGANSTDYRQGLIQWKLSELLEQRPDLKQRYDNDPALQASLITQLDANFFEWSQELDLDPSYQMQIVHQQDRKVASCHIFLNEPALNQHNINFVGDYTRLDPSLIEQGTLSDAGRLAFVMLKQAERCAADDFFSANHRDEAISDFNTLEKLKDYGASQQDVAFMTNLLHLKTFLRATFDEATSVSVQNLQAGKPILPLSAKSEATKIFQALLLGAADLKADNAPSITTDDMLNSPYIGKSDMTRRIATAYEFLEGDYRPQFDNLPETSQRALKNFVSACETLMPKLSKSAQTLAATATSYHNAVPQLLAHQRP